MLDIRIIAIPIIPTTTVILTTTRVKKIGLFVSKNSKNDSKIRFISNTNRNSRLGVPIHDRVRKIPPCHKKRNGGLNDSCPKRIDGKRNRTRVFPAKLATRPLVPFEKPKVRTREAISITRAIHSTIIATTSSIEARLPTTGRYHSRCRLGTVPTVMWNPTTRKIFLTWIPPRAVIRRYAVTKCPLSTRAIANAAADSFIEEIELDARIAREIEPR